MFEYYGSFDGSLDEVLGHTRTFRGGRDPKYQDRLLACIDLWESVQNGREDPYVIQQAFNPSSDFALQVMNKRWPMLFSEEITTSDFSALTADVLDRVLLANFMETPMHYPAIAKKSTLRDVRIVKRHRMGGGEGPPEDVPEGASFKNISALVQSDSTYSPKKYVNGEKLSWESVINDDLGIFGDIPQRMARGHRRRIERFATGLYVDANGPHASLYTAGNANQIIVANGAASANPVLGMAGIHDGFTVLFKQTDTDGEPIDVGGRVRLVVGPELYSTAMNLKNQLTVDIASLGGASNQVVRVSNWIASDFDVIRNPYIPVIASTANGGTSWFMFHDPNDGRPALEMGFLRGFDTPQLFRKAANTLRVGGGLAQELGDFQTMSQEFKAVTVFGGVRIEPKVTVASNGSAS